MSQKTIDVTPIAGSLGAEIRGVDLRTMDNHVWAQVHQAFLDHKVIAIRDQELSPQDIMDVGARLGEPNHYPFVKGMEGFPFLFDIVKEPVETRNFGGGWHSDTTYLAEPPMGSMLLAREVPPYGGDTMFANQYLAYDALSDGLKATLDGLVGVSSSAKADVTKTREDQMKAAGSELKVLSAEHPLVRTHPETGRKALYTSVAHTAHIKGWTEKESLPLLQFLWDHQTRPEFTCRFQWRAGSLAFWDNRCAMHNPINDYHGFRRVMHRITLKGSKPE